jgi:NAD(P)-dependent dehydrogenase (short-subunit alcohol dehydrogenase family)
MSALEKDIAWESSILGILHKQLLVRPKPLEPTTNLAGKTAIISGANSGLGFAAARPLLTFRLSTLVLTVRSHASGDAAAQKLRAEFPGGEVMVHVWLLDLDGYDSIITFVDRCRRDLPRINYAILNAGVQRSAFERNATTAHESVFQTNYLSTALLTLLLSSLMREQKKQQRQDRSLGHDQQPTVLTVVGSDTMYFSKLALRASPQDSDSTSPDPDGGHLFAIMDDPSRFAPLTQYADSKLLLTMFVAELAADIAVNVCNPGLTHGTELGRDANRLARAVMRPFVRALGRPVNVGASVYVYALLGEDPAASHGRFVSEWAVEPCVDPLSPFFSLSLLLLGVALAWLGLACFAERKD